MLFADDLAAWTRSRKEVAQLLEGIKKAERLGLVVNSKKTVAVSLDGSESGAIETSVGPIDIVDCKQAKYLGVPLASVGSSLADASIASAITAWFSRVHGHWCTS